MKKFITISGYIASQPADLRPKLILIMKSIQELVPDAKPMISYGMPAFKFHGMLVYFAAFKNHYSLFFGPAVIKKFLPVLGKYQTSKATIKIPASSPVPVALLKKLTRYAAKLNLEKAWLKELSKVSKKKK